MALLENILHIMGLDWLPTAERIRLTYNNCPKHISMFFALHLFTFPIARQSGCRTRQSIVAKPFQPHPLTLRHAFSENFRTSFSAGKPSKTRLIGDLIRLRRPVHRTILKNSRILPYDAPSEALLPIVILVAYVRNTQCSRVPGYIPDSLHVPLPSIPSM